MLKDSIELFARLLYYHSETGSPQDIRQEMESATDSTDLKVTLSSIEGKTYTVNRLDYIKLLSVFETVVAY